VARELKKDFERKRGFLHETWDQVPELDPDFFKTYTRFSAVPFRHCGGEGEDLGEEPAGRASGTGLSPKVKEFVYIAGGGNADKGAKKVDYMGVASPPLSRRAGWVLGVEDSEARLCGLLARRLRIAITNEFQCICLPPLFRRTIRRMLFAVKNTPPGR
jgi:hypothetical protein